MNIVPTPLSPVSSDYAFHPAADVDYVSLFEQCGIPLADLSTHLQAEIHPATMESTKQWYHGTAPGDDDPVALDSNQIVEDVPKTKLAACQSPLSVQNVRPGQKSSIDGFGNTVVSDRHNLQGDSKASGVSSSSHHEAVEHARRLPPQTPVSRRQSRSGTSAHSATAGVKALSPARRSDRAHRTSTSPSPPNSVRTNELARSPSESCLPRSGDMDFYAQRQYYAGAQLSSPISMQSCPEEDDTFLYTTTFSPEFNNFSGSGLNAPYMDSESMRRSMSTPFLGDRSLGALHTMGTTSLNMSPCLDTYPPEEMVPASNNMRWNTGEYLMPNRMAEHSDVSANSRNSISAARPTMKRKNRPMPIATNAPRSSGHIVPHTAPMEGRFVTRMNERPLLSAKRSYEDFSDFSNSPVDVPPYRHISTPISKRARSSQGFGSSIPASPFVESPLFSPMYNNGFSQGLDPEQLLLSSPPYTQSDFCSSPNYLLQSNNQEDLTQMFSPSSLPTHEYSYAKHEPLSAVDFEGIWPQKLAFERPAQINARPVIATPRSLTYGAGMPMRKTMSKARRSSTAKAISFCNYTAADKKTILSGVAPSGSNKKALSKAQEMNRSQSSSAIAV